MMLVIMINIIIIIHVIVSIINCLQLNIIACCSVFALAGEVLYGQLSIMYVHVEKAILLLLIE